MIGPVFQPPSVDKHSDYGGCGVSETANLPGSSFGGMKTSPLSYAMHLLPKVELHCHMGGTITPETWTRLAQKNNVPLPGNPADIFSRISSGWPDGFDYSHTRVPMVRLPDPDADRAVSLHLVFEWLFACMKDHDDFAMIAYECAKDAFQKSNIVYQEVFVGLTNLLTKHGLTYPTIVDGLIDGCHRAEAEFGVKTRLICGISRHSPASVGMEIVDLMIQYPRDEVIGIGLDGQEMAGAPELYTEVFHKAQAHGLKTTAHTSEHVPGAQNALTCLEILKCDRLDHGYFALEDDEIAKKCVDSGLHFTCSCTTSRRQWQPWRRASIGKMVEMGFDVGLCADDPSMFPTTLSREFAIAHEQIGLDAEQMERVWLAPIHGSWMSDDDKRALRKDFLEQAQRLGTFDAAS